ncbi:MAG: thioredoxin domain-containing protein [Anaerolineales bacterium]|nr:MAG: thioredoxin domain-containing protein [Anaerolineales bacterium]
MKETYVDTGKVRFGYWHFAFLGQESFWAAEASECAAEQDAFWVYHDLLFERHGGENQGAFSKENLKAFANELKLDSQAFNDCLDNNTFSTQVQTETNNARSMGVTSTPAFVINGQAVMGAQPFEVFEQIIEQELAKTSP